VKLLSVHVRINDAATSKPTPVRLRLFDAAGAYRPPFGRLAEFATSPSQDVGGQLRLGGERFAYLDGAGEVHLPPGPVTVEATKGPEYAPLRRTVTLGQGQISLRLAIDRWADLRADGWYSGDTRALFLPPHAARLEAAAEDLAVVNLLALETPPSEGRPSATPNLLAFSGSEPTLEAPGHLVAVNTLNAHPVLGTVSLLGCHRVVYPLRFGGDLPDDWSVADWCDQCHRKKTGLVVWPDLPRLRDDAPQGEALSAAILGKVDAFEVSRFDEPEPAVLGDWYRLLDCGLRLPLAGGSGKDSNGIALGAVRTYARLPEEATLTYAGWLDAVRAGRTFVTNGPLLTLTVDDQPPGSTLTVPSEGRTVRLHATARGVVPFDRLELLLNGSILAVKEASGNRQEARLETEFQVTASGWLAARCWSNERLADGQCVYAHSSPVYLACVERPLKPSPEMTAPLEAVLERTLGWVRDTANPGSEKHRERLAGALEAARQELARRRG
jgi:hypothetical protein